MNCLDYRREHLAEPAAGSAQHRAECADCAAWTLAQQHAERGVQRALAVPVPDGLAARVLMQSEWQRPRRYPRAFLGAMAAGLLAVAVLVGLELVPQPALANAVIEHVYHEPDLLLPATGAVDPQRLRDVLARVGGRLDGEVGTITHAGLCPVRGELAAHLVVAGAHGPVAELVMPAAAVARAEHVADEWFQGEIVPLAHGSVAVIGEHGEDLGELAARLQGALTLAADGV